MPTRESTSAKNILRSVIAVFSDWFDKVKYKAVKINYLNNNNYI